MTRTIIHYKYTMSKKTEYLIIFFIYAFRGTRHKNKTFQSFQSFYAPVEVSNGRTKNWENALISFKVHRMIFYSTFAHFMKIYCTIMDQVYTLDIHRYLFY